MIKFSSPVFFNYHQFSRIIVILIPGIEYLFCATGVGGYYPYSKTSREASAKEFKLSKTRSQLHLETLKVYQ